MISIIFIVLSLGIAYTFLYLRHQIWCLRIDNENLNNKFSLINNLTDKYLEKVQKAFDKIHDVEAKVISINAELAIQKNSINAELAIQKERIEELEFNQRKFNEFFNDHSEQLEILENFFIDGKKILKDIENRLNNSLCSNKQFKGLTEKLEEIDMTIEILKNSFQQMVPAISKDIFSNVFIEIEKLEETLRNHQEKIIKENGLEELHAKS